MTFTSAPGVVRVSRPLIFLPLRSQRATNVLSRRCRGVAVGTFFTLAPVRRPRPLATVGYFVDLWVNELPFALYRLGEIWDTFKLGATALVVAAGAANCPPQG